MIAPLARTPMTDGLFGGAMDAFDPEQVVPMAVYLVSEQCSLTGEIFSAGGGRFARAVVGVTRGWVSAEDRPAAEDIADHIDVIRADAEYVRPGQRRGGNRTREVPRLMATLDSPDGTRSATCCAAPRCATRTRPRSSSANCARPTPSSTHRQPHRQRADRARRRPGRPDRAVLATTRTASSWRRSRWRGSGRSWSRSTSCSAPTRSRYILEHSGATGDHRRGRAASPVAEQARRRRRRCAVVDRRRPTAGSRCDVLMAPRATRPSPRWRSPTTTSSRSPTPAAPSRGRRARCSRAAA